MGRPKFSWRKIVRQIFRPREGRGRSGTIAPTTPVKANIKSLRLSRSFSILRSFSTPSSETRDDTSSFMSPMPEELRPLSFADSDIFSSSDGVGDWGDLDRANSVRLSFLNCDRTIDTFPKPPSSFISQALPSQRPTESWRRPPVALPQSSSQDLGSKPKHNVRGFTKHKPKQVHSHAPTPLLRSNRYGSLDHTTTSIPFDLLSRTPAANGFSSNPNLQRPPSRTSLVSSASLRLQSSPVSSRPSSQSSLARSKSCTLLFRPLTPDPGSIGSCPTAFPPRRPPSRDARPMSPTSSPRKVIPLSPLSPCFSLESFHVPGLEHRAMRSSSSSLTSHSGTPNVSGSFVPIGTPRF